VGAVLCVGVVVALCHLALHAGSFGAGNAFWGLNINALAQSYNVYAVDWRGCGASLREPFTAKTAKQAEAWFVEGLERWRDAHPNQAHHLQKFVVVAHSLGAMIASAYVGASGMHACVCVCMCVFCCVRASLVSQSPTKGGLSPPNHFSPPHACFVCVCWQPTCCMHVFNVAHGAPNPKTAPHSTSYTLKHPDRVSQLILASPCGVPDAPERRDIPQAFRVIGYLWARGWTPHRIARWMGPIGPWFMRKLVEKRTSWMSPQSSINDGTLDKQLVAKYLYGICSVVCLCVCASVCVVRGAVWNVY